jgi:anaerobic magnesium-protoporphyrin IX monomethyl ester cyclase
MKTLIINPPCKKGFERSGRWPSKSTGGAFQEPLFLAYAAAVLEKNRLEVELIDCRPAYISLEELNKKNTSDVGLIVIQTSTPSIEEDIYSTEFLKKQNPKIKTVLVGPHPTIYYAEILEKNQLIDIVALGEYDYTVLDIAKAVKENKSFENIEGIAFKKDGRVIRTKPREAISDLDEMPFPARHFLPVEKYYSPLFSARPSLRLISSRGCPFQCTFCSWPQTMYGRKVRLRMPEKVVDEIEEMIDKFGAKELYFDDDTFGAIPEHAISICNEILKRKIKIPWICMGRVDRINGEVLQKLSEAGCRVIKYGVESGSAEILKNIKKGITPEQIKKAFALTKKYRIQSYATVIFGLPGETQETIKETINFVNKIDPDFVQFSIATPYPGTEFFEQAQKNNWLTAKNWSDYDSIDKSVIEYPHLKKEEIEQAINTAYRKFYFRPKYLLSQLLKIRSLKQLKQNFKGAINLSKKLLCGK